MAHKKFKKRWLFLLVPVAIYALSAILFQPLVDCETRKLLGVFEGYETSYGTARFHPLKFSYQLTDVKILKATAGGKAEPFFATQSFELKVDWRELLHRNIVARAEFVAPTLNLIAAHDKAEQQADPEIPDLKAKLDAVLPLEIARISIKNAEVIFIDKTEKEFPRIWLHDIDATMENLVTRAALAKGEPTILALSGTAQKNAEISLYATADPLAKGLFFSGKFRAAAVPLTEFKDIIASESGVQFDQGTLDVFAEFDCHAGKLSGGVKPLIKNGHIVQGKPGIGNKLKAVVADSALKIFSDRVNGRDAVATVIPISGNITDPKVQVWPTVIGIVRNAFVQGVSESYAHVPPPQADHQENPVKQLIKGLEKGKGPPKAQPNISPSPGAER